MLLLEGLVAILIFSFAVLALVGLQARMTSAQTEAKYRADASLLANEALALMWSDDPQNSSDATKGVLQYDGARCAEHAPCKDWQDKVSSQMPNGTGAVVVDSTTRMITVSVSWQHGSEDAHSYTMRSRIAEAAK